MKALLSAQSPQKLLFTKPPQSGNQVLPGNVVSAATMKLTEIKDVVLQIALVWHRFDPHFKFGSAHILKNKLCDRHVDKHNLALALMMSCGTFTENTGTLGCLHPQTGEFISVVTKNKLTLFNVRSEHWTEQWEGGDRFCVVFFTRVDSLHLKEDEPARFIGLESLA